jgi:signal transduction histidine kinase
LINKPSLLKRLLLGQLGILIFFASFAAVNFVWSFYREQGALEQTLVKYAGRIGLIVDRNLVERPSISNLQEIIDSYSMLLAEDISQEKLGKNVDESGLKVIVSVRHKNGEEIVRNRATENLGKIPPLSNGLHKVTVGEKSWQMAAVTTPSNLYVVQFAEPSETPLYAVRSVLLEYIVYPLAIFLPMAAIVMGLVIRFGLKPLNQLIQVIGKRNPDDLAPITVPKYYAETTTLVEALNNLLTKVSGTLSRERRFLADAAHELRTPLAVVQAQAHLLEIADDPKEKATAARELDRGIERAASLVTKLLTSAQLNSEEFKHQFVLSELNAIVQERIAALSVLAVKKDIELSFHQTEIITAPICLSLFNSALDNILDNAIRYTPSHGAIEISLRKGNQSQFVVAILDNGPGISPPLHEKAFERFYRVEGNEESGSGLGLAIAKQAMQVHKGEIKLSNGPKRVGLLAEIIGPLT